MVNERPCFACAYRRVGPMSGWEYCDAGLPSADFAIASQSCHAERQEGGQCGLRDGRWFRFARLMGDESRHA